MSEENKTVELKDEELEQVSGGETFGTQADCPDHKYTNRGYIGNSGKSCSNCTHFKAPEGPCNLGHSWWSMY